MPIKKLIQRGMNMDFNKKYIIAHRGASALVPFENTLESFVKAIEMGCLMMEFDVRLTKDHVMVSFHDEKIEEGKKISDLTYKQLNAIAHQKGFSVPTLEEILTVSKGKILLDIELKEGGYEQELIDMVLRYLHYDQFLMKSFLDEAIIRIKNINPHIRTGLILGVSKAKYGVFTRLSELLPMIRILRARPDFISPHYKLVLLGHLRKIQFMRLPLLVWTVNDEKLMEQLFNKGITAVITDRPDMGLKVMARMSALPWGQRNHSEIEKANKSI